MHIQVSLGWFLVIGNDLPDLKHVSDTRKVHVKQLFITNYGTNQCDILEAFFGGEGGGEGTQSAASLTNQILLYRLSTVYKKQNKKTNLTSAGSSALVLIIYFFWLVNKTSNEFWLVKFSQKHWILQIVLLGQRATSL